AAAAVAARCDGWWTAHPRLRNASTIAVHATLLAALAAAAVAYAVHVKRVYGGSTVDDAGITYAYAESLASGDGLRLTAGEAPTEGFSNPLEVLLLAPVARFADDVDAAAKWINIGALAAALALLCAFAYGELRSIARLLAVVPLGLAVYWCGFNYWVATGLEGGLLAALQILSLLAVHFAPRRPAADATLGVAAGLLAWTRPEGIAYGAIAVAVRALGSREGRRWLAPALFGAFVAVLYGLRWALFRDLVPNTYWAKVPARDLWWMLREEESPGRVYLTGFLRERAWYFALPLWAAAPAWNGGRTITVAAAGQLVFAVLFPVAAGGDWMSEWRLLQPMMGPLVVLSTVGLLAVLGAERRLARSLGRLLAALAVFALGAAVAFNAPTWKERRKQITARHDVDLRDVRRRVPGYHRLIEALHLPGDPLIAEIDIGGVSYRSGLEILDVAGLTDRAMALARARRPAVGPDYLFGERRPELFHLQASWLHATAYQRLSAFRTLYRELAAAHLRDFDIGGLLAVRADLLDPPAAAAAPLAAALGPVRLTGVTALPVADGTVLALHGRQATGGKPAPAVWTDAAGRRYVAPWHAGFTLQNAGPPGSVVVAVVRLPPDVPLPLALERTSVRLENWPAAAAGDHDAAALSRLPLLRLAGRPAGPCDPDRLLDPRAAAIDRARGAGFVARICGGLPPELAERWREGAMDAAEQADDPDDRYEAAAATLGLGLPQWLSTRVLLEETRPEHQPFDEVLDAWTRADLAGSLQDPARAAAALRLLLAGRRWSDALLEGLALGADRPELAGPICTASRRLGLRPDAVAPGLDCARVPDVALPRVVRQSFERPEDPLLHWIDDGSGTIRPTPMRRPHGNQREITGGHGGNLINTYGDGRRRDEVTAAVVWGPLPWQGRRFGALVGGGRDAGRLHVAVEGLFDGQWTTLARLTSATDEETLQALVADLGDRPADQVRVQVIDASRAGWGHILADQLTFIDDPAAATAPRP
ncbi:MAG: hypothetical protein GYA57_21820, partial [Myxococcales bacterium]|nr:hypothetical protein [Myxococcales bacterium]